MKNEQNMRSKPSKEDAINENKRILHKIANKFRLTAKRNGVEKEDLFSIAVEGLLILHNRYEPSMDMKFSTFVYSFLPREVFKLIIRSNKVAVHSGNSKRLAQKLLTIVGYEDMTLSQLSDITYETEESVAYALWFLNEEDPVEYMEFENYRYKTSGSNLSDFSTVYVDDFMSCLSERERTLATLKMQDKNRSQIARSIGCHANVVNQIMRERIRPKLRAYLEKAEV